jgi:hypothetical protein
VYVDAQLSEDATRRALGPAGRHDAIAMRQRSASPHRRAVPRAITCRPQREYAGCADTAIRL